MKILQAQIMVSASKKESMETVERACEQAAREQASMLTLPEMFCCPYETSNFPVYAEEKGGPVWQGCADLARKYGIYLSAGSVPERDEKGLIYNTAYVFDPKGNQIACHRKMHLFDIDVKGGQSFRESDTLTPGDSVTVFDTEFGRMGICICYDFRFPELVRLMVLKGAKLIIVPAAFNMTTGPAHWEIMFRAQAMFNQCFAVGTAPACNLDDTYHSWGHTIAVSPWGSIISQMGQEKGCQLVEIDFSEADKVRQQLPLLNHRRTDLYSLEVK
ncbi:MAG: carbon-nitrogen hydrolase family protein [Anaerovibrio sp.]|uniref:carbon-nitrogen hydrolase family protein n=1 Tax=Anaerovibrio sp. TaxID=1872532 RepID=UPI0025DFFB55|nr:carbon-nitrogen hydrolase family protein [Anaerovibrio sp.]MCR5177000.1 carbon-nitrogen hydrolase family protein [Anaerovibrio sp.]